MTRPLRFFLGAFGQPGHAFPMLALGRELVGRGHAVTYETWERWRQPAQAAGMDFRPAPEYPVFPTQERPLSLYEAVVRATAQTRPTVARAGPDVVVHDILTLAPALAGELEGLPVATLIPHVYPVGASGFPPYALGARMPRTGLGRTLWRVFDRPVARGLAQGRDQLNDTRHQLGLAPVTRFHGGLSTELVLVGTYPELEYPRNWPGHVHVVGPLIWEPPAEPVEPPPGDAPLVLVAPSTAQDPEHRLLRAALAGLGREPVRVLATWNRRPLDGPARVPANTRLVEWISYAQTMPKSALVICHAGHGTMVRALASGAAVLTVPHVGDMAENAARADWAGVGVRLPWSLLGPRSLALGVRRALERPQMANAVRRLTAANPIGGGPARAADLLEDLARRGRG
ncbi:MAG: glycosyl transferase [Actinomycetota bacterium]|nr:glycosyl transferase [Actinomycetota bacterium]